jgi:hypothetical protein
LLVVGRDTTQNFRIIIACDIHFWRMYYKESAFPWPLLAPFCLPIAPDSIWRRSQAMGLLESPTGLLPVLSETLRLPLALLPLGRQAASSLWLEPLKRSRREWHPPSSAPLKCSSTMKCSLSTPCSFCAPRWTLSQVITIFHV